MAFAYNPNSNAGQATAIASGTATTLLSATPTTGNLVVLSITNQTDGTLAGMTVTDNAGNSLTEYNSQAHGAQTAVSHWAYIVPASPQTKFTITLSGKTFDAAAYEFSGNANPIATDGTAVATSTSNAGNSTANPGPPSVTPGHANSLAISSVALNGGSGGTVTPSAGTLLERTPATSSAVMADAYSIQTTAVAFGPSFAWTTTRGRAQLVTTFRAANPAIGALESDAVAGTAATLSAPGALAPSVADASGGLSFTLTAPAPVTLTVSDPASAVTGVVEAALINVQGFSGFLGQYYWGSGLQGQGSDQRVALAGFESDAGTSVAATISAPASLTLGVAAGGGTTLGLSGGVTPAVGAGGAVSMALTAAAHVGAPTVSAAATVQPTLGVNQAEAPTMGATAGVTMALTTTAPIVVEMDATTAVRPTAAAIGTLSVGVQAYSGGSVAAGVDVYLPLSSSASSSMGLVITIYEPPMHTGVASTSVVAFELTVLTWRAIIDDFLAYSATVSDTAAFTATVGDHP